MDVQACVRTRQIYLRFKPGYYSKTKNNYPYDPCSPNKKILLTFVAFMEMLLINNFLSLFGLPLLTDGVSNGVFCTPVNKNMNKLVHKVLKKKKINKPPSPKETNYRYFQRYGSYAMLLT